MIAFLFFSGLRLFLLMMAVAMTLRIDFILW